MGTFRLTLRSRFEAVEEKTLDTFAETVGSVFSDVGTNIEPLSHNGYHNAIRENWEHFFGETPRRDAVNALIPDLTPSR